MPVMLPSSTSILEKVSEFRPEALEYRDMRFKAVIEKSDKKDQCLEMVGLLEKQTEESRLRYERVGDPWHGTLPVSRAEVEIGKLSKAEKDVAEREINDTLEVFQNNGVNAVRVDIAIGPNSEILVGYNSASGSLKKEDVSQMTAKLLNNSLFVDNSLVTKDSVILQARSLNTLKCDDNGKPMPGELAKIEQTLGNMKDRLEKVGVDCQIHQHDYAQVKAGMVKAKEQEPAQAPVAAQAQESATPTVEAQTKPDA